MTKKMESKLMGRVNALVIRKVFLKYQVMRVRQKISFHAFLKNYTILEIWLIAIKSSLGILRHTNQIDVSAEQ